MINLYEWGIHYQLLLSHRPTHESSLGDGLMNKKIQAQTAAELAFERHDRPADGERRRQALHPGARPGPRRVVLVQGGGAAARRGSPGDGARHGRVWGAPGAPPRGGVVRGLLAAAAPDGDRLVLVGHSLGGLSVALAMERFPGKVAAAVFLAASMPRVGSHMGVTIEEVSSNSFFSSGN